MYRSLYQQTVTRLVLGYFRQYIDNIEADFQLSLWGGDVVLNDLDLRLEVLNQQLGIDAPFAITRGFIKELKIRIAWSSITSTPVEIHLSSVQLTLSNNPHTANPAANPQSYAKHSNPYHPSSRHKAGRNGSDGVNSVDHDSLPHDVDIDGDAMDPLDGALPSKEPPLTASDSVTGGFISNLLMGIMANASVTIDDLAIKYMDHNCKCECRLEIGQFQTVATTLNWQPRPEKYDFLTPWKLCHRTSSFQRVSLFLGISTLNDTLQILLRFHLCPLLNGSSLLHSS